MKKSAPYLYIQSRKLIDLWERILALLGMKFNVAGCTAGWIVLSPKEMSPRTERHESIHVIQFMELSVFVSFVAAVLALFTPLTWWILLLMVVWAWTPLLGPMNLLYALIWLIRRTQMPGNQAYWGHPMEVEARSYEDGERPISGRLPMGWIDLES